MLGSTPLPPHLERFVHEQIATGSYHSEDEVIRAALHLLEGASFATPRPEGTTPGRPRPLPRSAFDERWHTPAEWRAGPPAAEPSLPRRSPRGLLADLHRGLTFDDVREAREELWAGLHPGRA